MTGKIRNQILKIRDGGRSNMMDYRTVQRLAYGAGFYELVMYIEENPKKYIQFIMTGEEG